MIFIDHGFVLVKVVEPTVAETPPAGILYVAESDVDEIGLADSLIMTEALADSPFAPRQSGPETRLTVPCTVIVSVVSCANIGAELSRHTVKNDKQSGKSCFILSPCGYYAGVWPRSTSVCRNARESKREKVQRYSGKWYRHGSATDIARAAKAATMPPQEQERNRPSGPGRSMGRAARLTRSSAPHGPDWV